MKTPAEYQNGEERRFKFKEGRFMVYFKELLKAFSLLTTRKVVSKFRSHNLKRNTKVGTQRCKAHHHWILKQWRCVLRSDESCLTIWQPEG